MAGRHAAEAETDKQPDKQHIALFFFFWISYHCGTAQGTGGAREKGRARGSSWLLAKGDLSLGWPAGASYHWRLSHKRQGLNNLLAAYPDKTAYAQVTTPDRRGHAKSRYHAKLTLTCSPGPDRPPGPAFGGCGCGASDHCQRACADEGHFEA